MATGGVPNIFECAVCLNYMLDRTPRSLPCLHTFCEECLQTLIKNEEIICPSCRKPAQVKDNDVKQVPVNFLLCQMKEFSLTAPEVKPKHETLCQICKKQIASYKCEDCPRIFCKPCKEGHATMKKYEGHVVYDLCAKHEEGMKYLCMECFVGLCEICIPEHKEHEDKTEDYNKTINRVSGESKKMTQNITTDINGYDKNFEKVLKKSKVNKELLQGLKDRKVYHEEKVRELCDLIKVAEDNQAALKELELEYEKNRFYSEEIKYEIDQIPENVSNFRKIPSLKLKAEEIQRSLQRNLDSEYNLLPFILCKQPPAKSVIPRLPEPTRNLQKSELLFTVEKKDGVGYCKQMALLGGYILAITQNNPSHVVRFNQKGEVTSHYYPEKKELPVLSVDVYKENIYILQKHSITVLSSDGKLVTLYKPEIDEMDKLLVVDDTTILVSDYREEGHIFSSNVKSNCVTFKTVVEGLKSPSYMNMTYTTEGHPLFIITEDTAHCVKVYSQSWQMLHTIGKPGTRGTVDGLLNLPGDIAITDQNTILVADWNNRICHFTLEGKFLSTVLLEKDGISEPAGLVYKNNMLWVCGWNSSDIKCFQLKYVN